MPNSRDVARSLRDRAWLEHADVALVSFPKSGRTFVRAMLARLYQLRFGIDERDLLDFRNLMRAPEPVPRLLFTHDGDARREPSRIKISTRAYEGCKVVLLARHPGDVAVSRYHHLRHRSRDPKRRQLAQQPLEQFIWSDEGGIPSIVAFLNAWAEYQRDRGGMMVLRYEDFVQDPRSTLTRLAGFIGLDCDEPQIADAVEFASADKLRQKERDGYFRSTRLRPKAPSEPNSFKVRAASGSGYRARLGEKEADRIDVYLAEHLQPVFGYSAQASASARVA